VPREIFVPHRFADLAHRAIACGQTLPEPWLTARMIEALAPLPRNRVLEIGTGSGYGTALLARLARVLSIERFKSLAIEAEARLARLAIANAGVVFGDGLAISPEIGPFDRVIVQGLLAEIPENLIAAWRGWTARCGAARSQDHVAPAYRTDRAQRRRGIDETSVCPSRLQALLRGEALAL
jgi:protein-L-isoaspartate(D-aspartate) O-methyltransferase